MTLPTTNSHATITATAPGKVILFGEHAINRGQSAVAAGVGLYARCHVTPTTDGLFRFRSGPHRLTVTSDELIVFTQQVEACRAAEDYNTIQRLVAENYFAPALYVLESVRKFGVAGGGLDIGWESEIPPSAGLGSGGAAFTALVAALSRLLPETPTLEQRAAWAHRGDILAHGGIASALDTQTSLFGGVLRYTGKGLAEALPFTPGLSLVIGNTGVVAATSEVNGRVRRWLAENPTGRMACFEGIGALARAAVPLLEKGDWPELGRLMTLNQLALEKIGVSCPEIERLIEAALGAGAYGAKLSGSGGGGIIVALVAPERRQAVVDAILQAGGIALTPEVGVPGVQSE